MRFHIIGFFVTALFLSACGGGYNPDLGASPNPTAASPNSVAPAGSAFGLNYTVLESAETLTSTQGSLSGTGKIRFKNTVPSPDTDIHVSYQIKISDFGSFCIVTFANVNLEDGVRICLNRSAKNASMQLHLNGIVDDWTKFFSSLDASKTLSLGFDIHNDELYTHVIAWEPGRKQLFDSGIDVAGTPGRGLGVYLGLELDSAELTALSFGPPKQPH